MQLIVLFVVVSRAKLQRIWNRWSSPSKTITLSSAQWNARKSSGFKRPISYIKYSFENRWKKRGVSFWLNLRSWYIFLSFLINLLHFASFCCTMSQSQFQTFFRSVNRAPLLSRRHMSHYVATAATLLLALHLLKCDTLKSWSDHYDPFSD